MNKTAIKSFAIEARKKLISEITYRAGLVGINKDVISEPIHKASGIEMYDIGGNEPYTIKGEEIVQRNSLASKVREKGFENVIEEVAYTWFNRIIAIRFMEVNDYLPTRVRVLSSENKEKIEPDIVTEAPNVDLGFTSTEIDEILQLKQDNELDELFRLLFIKQCNALNDILPELFEKTSDYTELLLNISFTNEDGIVRKLVRSIEEDDFREQVEIIGWLYQYYNIENNELVYDGSMKKDKVPKELLPAATQIFTPDWVVNYMVQNSLGKLALESLDLDESIKENWKYFIDNEDTHKKVLINVEEIKILDPAMGSGHMLVYAIDVLIEIYKACGYTERDAIKLILEKNLYGFDIDERAYQLAYFAVMMKARKYNRRIFNERIKPKIYSIHESNEISCELIEFVAKDDKDIKADLEYLVETFKDAKEYGSIVNVHDVDFDRISNCINNLKGEYTEDLFGIMHKDAMINNLKPIIKQAELMSQRYDVVITNPPYLSSSRMSDKLSKYVAKNYPNTKSDFSMIFYEKAINDYCKDDGFIAFITTTSWMFLKSFESIRKKVVEELEFESLVDFGTELFDGKVGHNPIVAWVNKKSKPTKKMSAIRLTEYCYSRREQKKTEFFNAKNRYSIKQGNFSKMPGIPIAYWVSDKVIKAYEVGINLGSLGKASEGIKTGNNEVYLRYWYEICNQKFSFAKKDNGFKWYPHHKGGEFRKWYGNLEWVINWENDGQSIKSSANSGLQGKEMYFKDVLCWSKITSKGTSMRYIPEYCLFDSGSPAFKSPNSLLYCLAFVNSCIGDFLLKSTNPTLNCQVGDIKALPLIIDNGLKDYVENLVQQNISISKTDWDSFEVSWDFQNHPFLKSRIKNEEYRIEDIFTEWQKVTTDRFVQLKANEEELNRVFIEIYALQDELKPEVEEKDVKIRRADLNRDIKSFISYSIGCMFGRYSLDNDGVVHAGGEWDASKYKTFIPDNDNIIPITDDEYFTDDIVGRFIEFVKVTYGEDTLEENLDFIAKALGGKGDTSRQIIRNYFIKDFYKDHVKTYQKKPIYWMFDSGKENGFKALIYTHRYNEDTVARVRADYLHKVQKAIENAIEGADIIIDSDISLAQKAKAVKQKEKLVKQLAETRNYDAAIAHVASKRIGIDLDDGVTVNYAKFQGVELSREGKKAVKIDLLSKI